MGPLESLSNLCTKDSEITVYMCMCLYDTYEYTHMHIVRINHASHVVFEYFMPITVLKNYEDSKKANSPFMKDFQ